jgi:hypothetical protein
MTSLCIFSGLMTSLFFQLSDDVDECRKTFEALNSQLLEELPKLLVISTNCYIFGGSGASS